MTLTGKVFRGALYFTSDMELLKALAPFEGQAVEVVVREAGSCICTDPVLSCPVHGR